MPSETSTTDDSLVLSGQDRAILFALSLKEYRYLTIDHVARLYFDGDRDNAEGRLEAFHDADLVQTLYLPVAEEDAPREPIYTLARAGADVLAAERHLPPRHLYASWKPRSYLFLRHTLRIADFRVAVVLATRQRDDLELLFWDNERALKRERKRFRKANPRRPFPIPDGYFAVKTSEATEYFFLEMDRGTMKLSSMDKKFRRYVSFFAQRIHKSWYRIPSFRVLVPVPSKSRERKLLRMLSNYRHCRGMFWLTSFQEDSVRSSIDERCIQAQAWRTASHSASRTLY